MDPPAAGGGGAGAAANANGLAPLPLPQVAAAADHDAAGGGGAGAAANANGLAPLPLPQVAAAADHDAAVLEEEEGHHDGAVVEEHLAAGVVGDQPLALAAAAPANLVPEAEEEEGHHDGAVVEEHLAAGVVGDQPLALAAAAPANLVPEAEEEEGHHDGAVVEEHLAAGVVGDQPLALAAAAPANLLPEAEEEEGHHDGAVVDEHLAAGVVGDQLLALAPAAPANPVHPQPQDALVHQHPEVVQQLLALAPPSAALEELPVVYEHGLAPPPPPPAALEEMPVVDKHGLAPPPPPPAALEELPVVNEHGLAPPPPPTVPTAAQVDWHYWVLAGVTVVVLFVVLVAELGVDITTWVTTLKQMTGRKWTVALLLAVGDLTSLCLTYTPAWRFRMMWRGEGEAVAAEIAALVPPVAGVINSAVWVCYALAVDGMNASIGIINGTAFIFQIGYAFIFCSRSQVTRARQLTVLLLGAGVGVSIAIVDVLILHGIFALKVDTAIARSGACTTAATYLVAAVGNMVAAHGNWGADGLPAQGLVSFVNAAVWLVYARVIDNPWMQASNGFGIFLLLVQLGQLVVYRVWKPQHEEGGEDLYEPLVPRTDEQV